MSSSNTVQVTTSSDESHYNEYLDKIRKEIRNAAENWFHIAYYVYEMKYFEYYKFKYDNIVDCCRAEFGVASPVCGSGCRVAKPSPCRRVRLAFACSSVDRH